MDRSVLSALLGSLIGISSLGVLGLVSANPSPAPEPPKGDGNWRLLNPITYENISVFPVVAGYTSDTSRFLTLEEGSPPAKSSLASKRPRASREAATASSANSLHERQRQSARSHQP